MRLLAPAKINPLLTVGARRPDGLHELVSVMQAVSLCDEVTLAPSDGFTLSVEPDGLVPTGDDNLAMRAARALATGRGAPGLAIGLRKHIPVAAGLAGGSADAAAVLVGAPQAWGTHVSRKGLEKVGAAIGSDVPFCVRGGTAVVAGAGEDLSSIACPSPVWWVLGVAAGGGLPTAEVYAAFDRLGGGRLGDPHDVADALARADVARLGRALHNDLQPAALSIAPALASGREALARAGALGVVLSGSGPTWCGLARDEEHARAMGVDVAGDFVRVEVVSSLAHGPRVVSP